ncbi:MAG: FAD-binding protein [Methanobacteriota archaeon]
MDRLDADVVVIGSGLAGLRAALEVSRQTAGRLTVAILTKVQAMRSHSVAAEGGSAAVLYPDEGDSFDAHVWDTVKGSDFLADQDAVELFVRSAPEELRLLERWGMPWPRRADGRIATRPFGGHSVPRTAFAGDKVGFLEMQTLYGAIQAFPNVTTYHETYATSILHEDGEFRGVAAIDLRTGGFLVVRARAGLLATRGAGRIYGFTTHGHHSTADGLAFRNSCRMGICGSCGVLINGEPRLACETSIASLGTAYVDVAPLPHFAVIRDLVTDFDDFFVHHRRIRPHLVRPENGAATPVDRELPQTEEERLAYYQFTMCIMCGLCDAACPVVGLDREFLGPQALAQAYRYAADSRDRGWSERSEIVDTLHGCWRCELAGSCSAVCPKGVDPALGVQLLKRAVLRRGARRT